MTVVGLCFAVIAIGLCSWRWHANRGRIAYPVGPILILELGKGFAAVGDPDPPRSVVATNRLGLEFQVLTVVTSEAAVEIGPLSKNYLDQIRIRQPQTREDISINGFNWHLEIGSVPLPQMQAICYADEYTIGVLGSGPWTREAALEALKGIHRRQITE